MATSTNDAKSADVIGPAGVRALKIAIVVMGVMIAAGLLAMIGRIVYFASKPGRPATVASVGVTAALAPHIAAELPSGASVRTISLGGDRLALHYEAPTGSGVLIVDLASGTVASRIDLVPAPPRN